MGAGCGLCKSWKREETEQVISPSSLGKDFRGTEDRISPPPNPATGRSAFRPHGLASDISVGSVTKEAPNAVISNKPQTHWEVQTISMAIHRHSVLTDLTEDARDVIISRMKHFRLGPDEVVFEQGWKGEHFFVVGSGTLEVLSNGTRVNLLKAGDSFGETALLHDVPRTASVRTIEKSDLWGLDRKTFTEVVKQVHVRNYTEIRYFIDTVQLFAMLTSQEKDNLMNALTSQRYLPDKHIVKEGEPGEIFYIIKEGTVTCSVNGTEIRKLHKGDYFGEQALLYNTTRTATVTADDTVRVLSIGREQLVEVLGSSLEAILCRNSLRIAIDKSKCLSNLTPAQKEKVLNGMQNASFPAGATVLEAGQDLSKAVRIVVKGKLMLADTAFRVCEVVADDVIASGEEALTAEPLLAAEHTDVAQVAKEELELLLGGELRTTIQKNENLAVLKSVSIFRGLPSEKLTSLLSVLQPQFYADKSVIVRKDEPGDALYIVNSGQVQVVKDDVVLRTIQENGFFGERSVLTNEVRTASVVAQGDVKCLVLHRQEFMRVMDESVTAFLAQRLELQDETVSLAHLVPIRCVGKGMFGGVYKVMHRSKGTRYALKAVSRRKIRAYDLVSSLQLERQILLELDHAFIVKLVKTFKDDARVYFLMELADGMDLFDVLRKLGTRYPGLLTEDQTKFYAASLLLALEHLHDRKIVYRDLKPENVVVNKDGYIKLVDFGTAKTIKGRTFTTIGTPHYMAPEVILGKGYGLAVDVWSLGIMVYEFLCGGVPFGEEEEDPFRIYEKILRDPLRWPSCVPRLSKVREFVETLLSKNEALRNSGIAHMKKHRWLHGFEWVKPTQEKLFLKQLPVPYKPEVADASEEEKQSLSRNLSLAEFIEDANEEGLSEGNPEVEGWDKDF